MLPTSLVYNQLQIFWYCFTLTDQVIITIIISKIILSSQVYSLLVRNYCKHLPKSIVTLKLNMIPGVFVCPNFRYFIINDKFETVYYLLH